MSTSSVPFALNQELMRDLVELSFIEEYGWTPDYIAQLPYKWIQKHNYMKKVKHAAQEAKRQTNLVHQQMNQIKPGQKKWQNV